MRCRKMVYGVVIPIWYEIFQGMRRKWDEFLAQVDNDSSNNNI